MTTPLQDQMDAVEVRRDPGIDREAYAYVHRRNDDLPFDEWTKRGCMVTSEGTPSLATDEREYRLVRTESFGDWSKDGCLKHPSGEPKRVWRGESSGSDFEEFDLGKTRVKTGFFFATAREHAESYASDQPRDFFLKGNNILDLRSVDYLDRKLMGFIRDYEAEFDDWTDRTTGEPLDVTSAIEVGTLYDYEASGSGHRWHRLFSMARAYGYDMVIAPDVTDGVREPVVVVFEPSQILFAECDQMKTGTGKPFHPVDLALPTQAYIFDPMDLALAGR